MAALVLFCGLPLGGCVALIGFGISEINERSDEIGEAAAIVMAEAIEQDADALQPLMDGGTGCVPATQLVETLLNGAAGASEWDETKVTFVDRDGGGYLSNVSEPELFVVAGRETDATAEVRGELIGRPGASPVKLTLLKPGATWRLCAAEFAL